MSGDRPDRPETLEFQADGVPSYIADRDDWLVWRYEWQSDRDEWAKIPKDGAGGDYRIDATDPENGVALDVALDTYETGDYDGLGIITDADDLLVGFDFDDCRDPEQPHGSVPDAVLDAFDDLNTYIEVSPSATGYRGFALGAKPEGRNRADLPCDPVLGDDVPHLEMYDGSGGRYLTVTGHHVDGTPETAETRPQEIKDIYNEFIAEDDETDDVAESAAASQPNDLDDRELIEKAKNAKNGDKFERLWNGNTSGYPSPSEARMALAELLAFWTGRDRHRMKRLFERSGLYSGDTEEIDRKLENYTLDKAIRRCDDTYDPSSNTPVGSTDEPVTDSEGDEIPSPTEFTVRNGGYAKWHAPRSEDDEGYYEQITNFQIEVLSRLTHADGTREFHLRIHPEDGDDYDITCEPVVFNDLRKFRREILTGWAVTFEGNQSDLNKLKQFVGTQAASDRTGTKLVGLHNDEWVTPHGSLTADGWTDDPETVFTDVDTPITTKFGLKPSEGAQYDSEAVSDILRLLPQTRKSERFLPVLGWFYAAPFRPLIQEWEGEFNILNVLGDTGSGKTTTLETLWNAFGVDGELLRADNTPFPIMKAIASSNALPVVFDEYKPAEMRDYHVDKLHSYLRTSTRGGVEQKGRADMGVDSYHLRAPVCVSGEQPIQGPAEERRSILTVFTRKVTVGGTPESEAFARLSGGEVGGDWYDGYDLTEHATAYYQWVLQQDVDALLDLWKDCQSRVTELLAEHGHSGLDDVVIQGYQTVLFGCTLYRQFASSVGVETTPVSDEDIEQAILYVAGEGGADHTSHLDRFLGVATRAAAAGYLEDGEHYTVVHQGEPNAELRLKLNTAFDKVRKYAREHDVKGDDLLSSANDYKARIKDAAENPESYVTTASKNTPPLNRCVGIHITDAAELVDGFEPEPFGANSRDESDESNDAGSEVKLTDLDPSRGQTVTFTATAASKLDPAPWLQSEGILQDDSGVMRYIARGDTNPAGGFDEGERIEVRDAMVTTNGDGATVVELVDGLTTIVSATTPTQQSGLEQAATDGGGDDVDDKGEQSDATNGELKECAIKYVANARDNATGTTEVHEHVAGEFDVDLERAKDAIRDSRLTYHADSEVYTL